MDPSSSDCADDEATVSDAEETMHMYEQMLNRAKRASTVQRLTAKIRTLAFAINKARNKTLLENLQCSDFIDLESSEGSDDFSDDFSDQMDKIDDDMVQPAQWHSMPYSRSGSPVITEDTEENCNCSHLRYYFWFCESGFSVGSCVSAGILAVCATFALVFPFVASWFLFQFLLSCSFG